MTTTDAFEKRDLAHVESQHHVDNFDEKHPDVTTRTVVADINEGYSHTEIKAATRKIDRRLIPVLSLLYCISFIDRCVSPTDELLRGGTRC